MRGALQGALGMKPSTLDDMEAEKEPADDVTTDVEPNALELAAAKEFQAAARTGSPADLVRAFRGLKSACDADYGEDG